jgi:hypothetical protein
MTLPIKLSYRPMEAEPASELPKGREWQYEPKWDGFRCLAYRDGKRIDLQSKSQKALQSLKMVRSVPEAYVSAMSKAKRKGKIFLDYFRNGLHGDGNCRFRGPCASRRASCGSSGMERVGQIAFCQSIYDKRRAETP